MQQSLLKMRREDWHWQTLIAETLKDTSVTQFLCGAESELEPSPWVFYRKGPYGGRGNSVAVTPHPDQDGEVGAMISRCPLDKE